MQHNFFIRGKKIFFRGSKRTRWVRADEAPSEDEDLIETDLEEMLNSQPIEEEATTSTGNVTLTYFEKS